MNFIREPLKPVRGGEEQYLTGKGEIGDHSNCASKWLALFAEHNSDDANKNNNHDS